MSYVTLYPFVVVTSTIIYNIVVSALVMCSIVDKGKSLKVVCTECVKLNIYLNNYQLSLTFKFGSLIFIGVLTAYAIDSIKKK